MSDQHSYADPTEIRHTIGPNGSLTIHNISGQVDLRGADTDEVVVMARSENGRSESLPLTVRRTDGGLHIEVEKQSFDLFGSFFRGHDGLVFDVTLPRGARVEIKTVSADINARSLAGEQAYKTISGDVTVDADGGRLRVTTVSGDVEVKPSTHLELNVSTTSGDVEVSGGTLAAFEARTVSGDVDLRTGLDAGPLHAVETVSGDFSLDSRTGVTVDIKRGMDMSRGDGRRKVVGDGAAQLRFRTLSGDARVKGDHPAPMSRGPASASVVAAPPERAQPAEQAIDVLRALERGEIDIEEASRRLQEARNA